MMTTSLSSLGPSETRRKTLDWKEVEWGDDRATSQDPQQTQIDGGYDSSHMKLRREADKHI